MPATILIVDDEERNLIALEALLGSLGQPIVRATSGAAAIEELRRRDIAVVVLDVMMPYLDGIDTAALIRERPKHRDLPIIFLTAFDTDPIAIRRAYDVGAVDFLTKPVDPDILRHKVGAFVRMHLQSVALSAQAEELRRQHFEIERAERNRAAREVILGVLGHDLRNPLTAISMSAAQLHRASVRHRNMATRISRASSRMNALIENILDYTRGALGGGIPIARSQTNFVSVCWSAIEELRAAHPQHVIDWHSDESIVGEWDGMRLAQVVSNLIGNAIQHGSAGMPVSVSLRNTPGGAVLSVTNAGAISRELLPKIFAPFERGPKESKGLGLGLYIVREIIRAHGGEIRVDAHANPDRTTFTAVLPRTPVDTTP
ncbi:MAG: bphP8 [Myxococcales bacterium]|nr:bphP8 [Myxococcales bacterium]